MKKSLALVPLLIFAPIAFSISFCQDQVNNECLSENEFPCMKYFGCCLSKIQFLHGVDCEGTEIHFEEISEDFCFSNNYIGLNGNFTFLNITTKAKYYGSEYENFEINCTFNRESFCVLQSKIGLINCTIFNPNFKIMESNFIECNIYHPILFLIKNSTSLNFKTFNFFVKVDLAEIYEGTTILPISIKSESIIPTDFTLKLSTQNKNVKIYEEVKKTNVLNCKEEERISYLIEVMSPGLINFNLFAKPNLSIPCSQDYDCSSFNNGKCINSECWASYNFLIQVKSKMPEFDYSYVYTFFLSILALIFIILLVEAIVRK